MTNHTQAELDELNSNIYALYYDKTADDTSNNQLVHNLLDEYIYDESLLNASVCIEIDAASGQVYSVFYDTNSDKLRFYGQHRPDQYYRPQLQPPPQ